ncbi:MAG: ATP-binding protein [bacterium]
MTIGKKLIGGFCIILALMIVLSIVVFSSIARMNRASDTLIENLELDMFLDEKIGDHLRWVIELSDKILLGKSFEGELDPSMCDFGRWYYTFRSDDPALMKIHASMEEPHSRLHHSATRIRDLCDAGAIEQAKRVYVEETGPAIEELQDKIEELLNLSMKKIAEAKREYEATGRISLVAVAVVVFLAMIISLAIAIVISKSISTSIRTLTHASSMIAQGDLDTTIEIKTRDEIGDLAKSFNTMVRDLKEFMQKTNALAAAEATAAVEKKKAIELNQIYNGSPSGIRVIDTDFNILSENEAMAKVSGVAKKNGIRMKCYDQMRGAQCDSEQCTLRQIMDGKELIDTEVVKERVDGTRIFCRLMASPYKDMEGNTIGIIEVFTDITELKETQERLVRSEKLAVLGKLSGTLGHELRNPLGAISNSVYFLKRKLDHIQDEKIKKHLDIIEEEINISTRIISDILTFSKVKRPQLSRVTIGDVINESLAKVHVPRTIQVRMDMQNGLPPIMADAIQLRQVFSNIIVNAIQAMPAGGVLTITGAEKDGWVEVAFLDTGEGIPQENLNKIFEPLFSTKDLGTGLGLSVCQSIIDMHKGRIGIESEVKKGTRFTIQLPITHNERPEPDRGHGGFP